MIILHLFVALERLGTAGQEGRTLARLLSETFVTDIDDCLREMGVGDLSVPKKVKRAAQALGERSQAYRAAATSPGASVALAAEIASTVSGLADKPASASALAHYVLSARALMAALPDKNLLAGDLPFPPPES